MIQRMRNLGLYLLLLPSCVDGFTPIQPQSTLFSTMSRTNPTPIGKLQLIPNDSNEESKQQTSLVERVWNRLDTLKAAGLKTETNQPLYQIGFKNGVILFCLAFGYKWYRARFINKIPVWDRQPQWNTVVTNKEQEKELKAYTCKTCGSTIFIARHRRWYFEGTFGLGGLGCYTCGAKGKDNFVMDRDRIVEDVGDEDDYFDYERPLDFVSAAERRKLLKEAGGDEEAANKLLVDQAEESGGAEPAEDLPDFALSQEEETEETSADTIEEPEEEEEAVEVESVAETDSETEEQPEVVLEEKIPDPPVKASTPKPAVTTPLSDDDIFDLLDMD